MSELRLNVVTKEWVIIAPERGSRPREIKPQASARPPLPVHDPNCPFCPGNERETETEVFRLGNGEGDGSDWATRVVLNRYPVLSREHVSPDQKHHGLRHSLQGFGVHEVIIDTPRHDIATARMPPTVRSSRMTSVPQWMAIPRACIAVATWPRASSSKPRRICAPR